MKDQLTIVNMTKARINKFVLFIFLAALLFGFFACKTAKTKMENRFENEFISIPNLDCKETKNMEAIDSEIGTLSCNGITFSYDYGKFSNPGPITPKEEFRRSFDTYHHIKFFEHRYIDPKVYRIFLDSVKVIDVRRKKTDDELMIHCDPCNTTAEVSFKGDIYLYPFTMSERQLNMEGITFRFEERNGFSHKYYQEEGGRPGLYITPIENRFKKKNSLSIQVVESNLPDKEIWEILKRIDLKWSK